MAIMIDSFNKLSRTCHAFNSETKDFQSSNTLVTKLWNKTNDCYVHAVAAVPARMAKDTFEQMYVIENVIGNGGFGVVYAGARKIDGLPVSIQLKPLF